MDGTVKSDELDRDSQTLAQLLQGVAVDRVKSALKVHESSKEGYCRPVQRPVLSMLLSQHT